MHATHTQEYKFTLTPFIIFLFLLGDFFNYFSHFHPHLSISKPHHLPLGTKNPDHATSPSFHQSRHSSNIADVSPPYTLLLLFYKAPSTSAPYPTPSSTRPAAAATRCRTVGHSCTRKTSGCAGLVPSAVQLVLKQTPLSPAPPRCLLARLTTKVNITRLPTQEGSDMFTCRLFRARVRVHAKCGVKKSERAHARVPGSFLLPPPLHHHPSPPVPFLKCEAFVGGGRGRWDSGRGTTNSSSSVSGYCSLLWRAPVYIDLPTAWQDRIPFFAAFQTQMFRHSLLFLLTTDNLGESQYHTF